jgi:hypothetical protein
MYRGHLKVPRREGELGFQSSADQSRHRQLFMRGEHPVIPEFNPVDPKQSYELVAYHGTDCEMI